MKETKCACGAITVEIDGISYSMRPETFLATFKRRPRAKRATLHNCNHCVNHWGTDLCGCGSGELFGKCENRFRECTLPSQSIEAARQCVKAGDSWV